MGVFAGMSFAALIASATAAEELTFLTWDDYIDPEIVSEFEAEFGVDLNIAVFALDEARDRLMVTRGPSEYDLMMLNGASVKGYVRRNWLAPVSTVDVPNLRHVSPVWLKSHEGVEGYAVPYFWGTFGIAYRSDLFSGPFSSWRQLMEPEEALRGRISMMGVGRDLLTPALKMLGHSLNFTDPGVVPAVEAVLQAQKPYVKSYTYLSLREDSSIVTGDIWATLMYNGAAKMLQAHHPAIQYAVPEEGTNLWVDYIGISGQSPRKALAAKFIDFINRPKIAARNARWVYLATPNTAAEKHLPDSFLQDPIIYPSQAVQNRSEFYTSLSPRVNKSVNALLNRLAK
jgi:spermidine/putrescine transport system substrate-binding protein